MFVTGVLVHQCMPLFRKCCTCPRTRIGQPETEEVEDRYVESIQSVENSVESIQSVENSVESIQSVENSVENIQSVETSVEETSFGGYEDRIQVCEDEDLPPSYARFSCYPKVESEEAMEQPPPYRDSMRMGEDSRVTIETVSETVHGRSITYTIRSNSTSAIIM